MTFGNPLPDSRGAPAGSDRRWEIGRRAGPVGRSMSPMSGRGVRRAGPQNATTAGLRRTERVLRRPVCADMLQPTAPASGCSHSGDHRGAGPRETSGTRRLGTTRAPNGRPSEHKLAAIVESTIELADPERIVPSGSAARGEINEGSDLDLLAVAENARSARKDATDQARAAQRTARCRHCSRRRGRSQPPRPCCFLHDALREGLLCV